MFSPALNPRDLNVRNMSGIFSLVNRIVRNNLYACQVFPGLFSGVVLPGTERVLPEGVPGGGGVVLQPASICLTQGPVAPWLWMNPHW